MSILLGAALVFFIFPKHEDEERLLASYHAHDTGLVAVTASGSFQPSGEPAR